MSAANRINKDFKEVPVLFLDDASKIVLFSDCHRGTGNWNDNFLKNQNLYFAALTYYYQQNFTYIELGDGDELWENRSVTQVKSIHSNTYWLLSQFYKQNRLWLLYGNHDMAKKNPKYSDSNFSTYQDSTGKIKPLFPGGTFHSGIILKDTASQTKFCLTHGHQADYLNSVLWKTARFLVRYIWQPLEHAGVLDPTSAAKNNTKKDNTERVLVKWAKRNRCAVIAGHTHRPMVGSPDSPYFNTGSCVHPRCITCIELLNRSLTLVKWTLGTREDRSLYVAREPLADPVSIDAFTTNISL